MRVLNRERLKEQVSATILADIESGRVGGAAVSVTQDGQSIYKECFGNEKIGIRVSENTMFRMASMTKPITTVAILLLVDRGDLELDTPISDFLPAFKQMYVGCIKQDIIERVKPARTLITIRHLLSHTSGLGSGPVGEYISTRILAGERKKLAQVVDCYAKNPLDFEPYTSQAYSGIHAFDVLGRIVEIVSGLTYDKFLKKELFYPIGMVDTTFTPVMEQWNRIIPMHSYENGIGVVVDSPKTVFDGISNTCFSGSAGLASTLNDYQKFASMLLNYGCCNGRQLISEKLIREMATPQLPHSIMCGSEVWGLGVRVITGESYADLPCGAYGWSGAYGTHFWIDPVNRITAIYLKNSRYDGGACALTARHFEKDVNAALC